MQRRQFLRGAVASTAVATNGLAQAQGALWPEPLRIFIPYPAGGRGSFLAHTLASALGSAVSVAHGNGDPMDEIRQFAQSPPDARTVLLTGLRLPRSGIDLADATALLQRALGAQHRDSQAGRDMLAQLATRLGKRDDENTLLTRLVPVTVVARDPWVLLMNPLRADALGIGNTPDLLRYLRAHPGRLSIATGNGSSIGTFASELFKSLTQTYCVRLSVPQLMPDIQMVVDGRADLLFAPLSAARTDIRRGALRAIGVTSTADDARAGVDALGPARAPMPIQQAEPALSRFAAYSVYPLLAPPGTSPELAKRLQHACAQALAQESVQHTLLRNNSIPGGETAAQFQQLEQDEALRQVLAATRW